MNASELPDPGVGVGMSYWTARVAGCFAFAGAGAGAVMLVLADGELMWLVAGWLTVGLFSINGCIAALLSLVGWGFVTDRDGIVLRRGRKQEKVAWAQIRDVEVHGGAGWARLRLVSPERSVIVPDRTSTTLPFGTGSWWTKSGNQWIIRPRAASSAGAGGAEVDGSTLRAVRLGAVRRGYERAKVEAFLARCATALDALPGAGRGLRAEDVRSVEFGLQRGGVDPDEVDEILERVYRRLVVLEENQPPNPPAG